MHSATPKIGAPWNEVLRACTTGELHPCVFGMRMWLQRDRHEPRHVGLVLTSGKRSHDLESVYVCPCGGFALGEPGRVVIDDISTTIGGATFADGLTDSMRQVRAELAQAPSAILRTVAVDIHADLVRQLAVHATRWNIPPFALLGRTRARPAQCVHRRA